MPFTKFCKAGSVAGCLVKKETNVFAGTLNPERNVVRACVLRLALWLDAEELPNPMFTHPKHLCLLLSLNGSICRMTPASVHYARNDTPFIFQPNPQ